MLNSVYLDHAIKRGLTGAIVHASKIMPLHRIAPEEVQRIALAERLDHLRHAHLWTDRARQRAAHDVALRIYAPVAERVHPTMARRYASQSRCSPISPR